MMMITMKGSNNQHLALLLFENDEFVYLLSMLLVFTIDDLLVVLLIVYL